MKKPSPAAVAIVVSRFNEEITEALLRSCLMRLKASGLREADIPVVRVPGAYEIPWAAHELAAGGRYDAVVCLGAVLKGQTPQNDYISASTVSHLHDIALSTRTPCILGIMTPNTYRQALARTRGGLDRGKEAAEAALAMAALKRAMRPRGS